MNAYEARIMHEVRGEGKEREGGRRGKTRERGATFCLTRSYQLCFLPLRPPPPPLLSSSIKNFLGNLWSHPPRYRSRPYQ